MTEQATIDLTAVIDTHLELYAMADVERRNQLIRQVWADGGQLIDPPFDGMGHDEISGMVDVVLQHYAGHTFRRTTAVDAHHDTARYEWELVAPDGTVFIAGLDIAALAPDGRLARIAGFFGDLPPADAAA